MSVGLILYVINMEDLSHDEIIPQHMLTIENALLIEYLIESGRYLPINILPDDKKLYVLSGDEEMPVCVNRNLYGGKLSYILSHEFNSIPKAILKEESKTVKAIVKFIGNLPESVIILYYT